MNKRTEFFATDVALQRPITWLISQASMATNNSCVEIMWMMMMMMMMILITHWTLDLGRLYVIWLTGFNTPVSCPCPSYFDQVATSWLLLWLAASRQGPQGRPVAARCFKFIPLELEAGSLHRVDPTTIRSLPRKGQANKSQEDYDSIVNLEYSIKSNHFQGIRPRI